MPDIFLSYSREDQATARRYADALVREGFDVWWDQALSVGEAFDKVTERALDEARAVVVLWSKHSVDSRWVRAEATQALAGNRLAPVMIEACRRPIMFELTQTAELAHWKGDHDDPAWRAFIGGLRRMVGTEQNGVPASVVPASAVPGAGPRVARGAPGRPLLIGIAVLLLAGGGLAWVLRDRSAADASSAPAPTATASDGVTLAVLPFANLSADPEQEYFSDGLTEEILNQLAQVPALRLTGRTSSFSFKDRNEDLREIGRKLGVANLLEGSVRRNGDRIRVTAQLIRADDGTHQWSKAYDRSLSNVFAVQDEIARDVAQALSVKLDVTTLNRAQGGTSNVEAHDRYLRWRKLFLSEQMNREATRQQLQLLREAVALDPQFAVAWDELATLLERLARGPAQGITAEQFAAEAAQARQRVAQLAPDSWMVQRELAYSLWAEGRWQEAIAVARAIMDKGPFTREHAFPYTNLIFSVGRIEETIDVVQRVKAIEPLEMWVSRDLQWDLTAVGRIAEAEVEYERSKGLAGSSRNPDNIALLRMLSREGTDPAALQAQFRKVLDAPGAPAPQYLRDLADHGGNREAMRASLQRHFEARPDAGIRLYADALGDAELSLAAMRVDWDGPSPDYEKYWELFLTPYSGMRRLPGYKELMREVGLADYWRRTGEWGDICRPVGEEDFECR